MKRHLPSLLPLGLASLTLAPMTACAAELPTFARSEYRRPTVDITIANPDFEGRDGWVQGDGSPFKPTNVCSSGSQACRLDGGMVKTGLIPLEPGEEFFFSAYTKVDNLRTINAEVAYFGADRQWLRDGFGPLARGDQYSWQKINGHFLNSREDVHYITLQFYGAGELDDVKVWKMGKAPDNGDTAKAMLNINLPRENNELFFYVANENFEAWISRETGLLTELVSLQPEPMVIQPAGWNSMQLYLESEAAGVDGDFNIVTDFDSPDEKTLVFLLTSDDPAVAALADVVLTYTFNDDRLDVKAEYIFKESDPNAFKFGLRNVFRADEWESAIYTTFPISAIPADRGIRAAFYYHPGDHTIKTVTVMMPFAFLTAPDRFMAWGSLDIGNANVLTPNDINWRLPAMQCGEDSLHAGTVRTISSFYAVFPKATNELTQVMKYCVDNICSSNPLMTELIANRDREPRYFTPGAFAWYHPGAVPPGCDGWRRDMLDRHAENVWYSWWSNWTEESLTEGDWYTYDCRHLSAEGIREEIAYMQDMGLNVYLYFRQFLAENGTYDDHAPYKKWLGRDEEGRRQAFIDFPVPRPELLGGAEKVYWTCADFGQQDCREWYVEMVKKCIDFYRPKGLAWDMGFSSSYSVGAPEVGLGNGTLWIQATIYNWLKEKYPEMRVATNESFCSPSALFGDCILIEGAWRVGKKSELDYWLAKGFGKTVFSLQLIDDYLIQLIPRRDTGKYNHLRVKARAGQLIEAVAGPSGDLIKNGLKPDGTWQELMIPYNLAEFKTPSVSVRTGDDNGGWLEVAEAVLVSDDPGVPPMVIFDQNTRADDFVTSRKWHHREPGVGRVENTDDGIRISVDGVNKAYDAFSIEAVRQEWYDINLKVLGLGAICSDAQVPAFKELNAFSGQLAAMRHLSDRKLIYNAPDGVYGTFWARDDRTAGAIYNGTAEAQSLSLLLDRTVFPDGGKGLENGSVTIRNVDRQGTVSPADFRLTGDADALCLEGTLAPGNLLILQNWED